MTPVLKRIAVTFLALALLLFWLFTGYVLSYYDEEGHTTYFAKRYPTFRVEFYNPDASESDYKAFDNLSIEKKQAILDYCKYRYGVTSSRTDDIERCRKQTFGNP